MGAAVNPSPRRRPFGGLRAAMGRFTDSRFRSRVLVTGAVAASAVGLITGAAVTGGGGGGGGGTGTCDRNATTSTIQTQLSAATSGQTICLSAGVYADFGTGLGQNYGVTKALPAVTLTPAPGVAKSAVQFYTDFRNPNAGVQGITLDGVQIGGGTLCGPTKNFTIKNSHFTGQLVVYASANNNSCSSSPALSNANILIDSNYLDMSGNPKSPGNVEGMLGFLGDTTTSQGVTVSNNEFDGSITHACYDGWQVTVEGGNGVTFNRNVVHDLKQTTCNSSYYSNNPTSAPHVDGSQWVGGSGNAPGMTVSNNYYHDNTHGLVAFDGGGMKVSVINNVFQHLGENDPSQIQQAVCLGGFASPIIEHNTLTDVPLNLCVTHQNASVTNATVRNNYFGGGPIVFQASSNASINDYNMYPGGGTGAHSVNGTASWVGGLNPTTFAGFSLTAGSPGTGAASDGTNIGVN